MKISQLGRMGLTDMAERVEFETYWRKKFPSILGSAYVTKRFDYTKYILPEPRSPASAGWTKCTSVERMPN